MSTAARIASMVGRDRAFEEQIARPVDRTETVSNFLSFQQNNRADRTQSLRERQFELSAARAEQDMRIKEILFPLEMKQTIMTTKLAEREAGIASAALEDQGTLKLFQDELSLTNSEEQALEVVQKYTPNFRTPQAQQAAVSAANQWRASSLFNEQRKEKEAQVLLLQQRQLQDEKLSTILLESGLNPADHIVDGKLIRGTALAEINSRRQALNEQQTAFVDSLIRTGQFDMKIETDTAQGKVTLTSKDEPSFSSGGRLTEVQKEKIKRLDSEIDNIDRQKNKLAEASGASLLPDDERRIGVLEMQKQNALLKRSRILNDAEGAQAPTPARDAATSAATPTPTPALESPSPAQSDDLSERKRVNDLIDEAQRSGGVATHGGFTLVREGTRAFEELKDKYKVLTTQDGKTRAVAIPQI